MKQFVKEENNRYLDKLFDSLPWLIIAVAALVRFWGFNEWSLANDELSSLVRSQYPTLSEVINKGVIPDVHPAFWETFMHFWLKIFGDSVSSFRLPSVLFGIAANIFFYLFAKEWTNKKAATLAVAIFAFSQLFVLYSQIARAYAPGLFFITAFAFYWAKILNSSPKTTHQIGFVLFGVLLTITHYMAALCLFVILLLGLLKLEKPTIKRYFLLSISIGILFLPHLSITLTHLQKGGVGWLDKPCPDYIWRFLDFVTNESLLFQLLILVIPFFAFLISARKLQYKNITLALAVFVLNYLIIYYYSVHRSSIIQFSVLIFSTPFLVIFLTGLASRLNKKSIVIGSLIIALLGFNSLVNGIHFYQKKRFSNFKGVVEKSLEYKNMYSKAGMVAISNVNNPKYFKYYMTQLGDSLEFDIDQINIETDFAKARDLLKNTKAQYCMISFANVPVPSTIHEFAKQYFPFIVNQDRYFNSEVIVYAKSDLERTVHYISNSLIDSQWEIDKSQLNDSIYFSEAPSFELKKETQYALTFRGHVGDLTDSVNRWLTISAHLYSQDTSNIKVVIDVKRNDESIHWHGFATKQFYLPNQWYQFLGVWDRPKDLNDDDEIAIYIWNPNKSEAFIDDFSLTNFADSDYEYYNY